MDADRLNALLIDPTLGTRDDYAAIIQLAEEYPYAQFLRILSAKIARLLNEEEQVKMLHSAAIYSADRKVLKKYYTSEYYQSVIPNDKITLHEPKVVFPDLSASPGKEEADEPPDDSETATGTEEKEDKVWNSKDEMLKDVMNNLRELEHLRSNLEQPDTAETGTGETEKPSRTGEINPDDNHPENSKTENPESAQPVNYQNQLIDEFISNLSKVKAKTLLPPPPEATNKDLASESIAFDTNLVTETLAKLYVKQGKTDKAIEIYKKLIWKFPQKKAYFAARIEELNG